MELLRQKAQNAFEELRTISEAMEFVGKKLQKNLDFKEHEAAYREEFRLAMDMASAYERLNICLNKLAADKELQFFVNKLRKAAAKLMKVEVINVNGDV